MSEPWSRRWRASVPFTRALARIVFRLRVEGKENIPHGAVVVAANHVSHVDPPFVGTAFVRPMKFMAAADLQGINRPLDFFLRYYGTIPLPRSGIPFGAMKHAVSHLESGGAVGVFPEGRRVEQWGTQRPYQGAAWLALRAGVPLLPVAVRGTTDVMPLEARMIRPAPVTVTICPQLEPEGDRGSLTKLWVASIDSVIAGGQQRSG